MSLKTRATDPVWTSTLMPVQRLRTPQGRPSNTSSRLSPSNNGYNLQVIFCGMEGQHTVKLVVVKSFPSAHYSKHLRRKGALQAQHWGVYSVVRLQGLLGSVFRFPCCPPFNIAGSAQNRLADISPLLVDRCFCSMAQQVLLSTTYANSTSPGACLRL
eukprot:scpid75382/ scgid16372/ 